MVRRHTLGDGIVDALLYIVLTLLGLAALLPFVRVVAVSLSSAAAVLSGAVGLWPVHFYLGNYVRVLRDVPFYRALGVSVLRVGIGVLLTLGMTVITAYPLSLDDVRLPGRGTFKFLLLFAMLFNGGLIPTYLAYSSLGLLNSFWVLVLPGTLSIFFVILMSNFLRGIPRELAEAATMDGATHVDILFRIYLPVSLPSLATVTVFSALGHWNAWFDGLLYLKESFRWPLQTYAYQRIVSTGLQAKAGYLKDTTITDLSDITPEGLRAALLVLATIPVLLVYPLLQRYFVTGLTLGAIKE